MFPRKYPPILPAATPRPEAPLSSAEEALQEGTKTLLEETNKRKRIGTQLACNSCRVKKTRVRLPARPVSATSLALFACCRMIGH